MREALLSLAPLWQDRRDAGKARQAIIDASPALQARERAKQASLEHTLSGGLTARGTAEPQARLVARAAVACLTEAITQWFHDPDPRAPGLEARGRQAFTDLAALLHPSR